MDAYKTEVWGQVYAVRANWAEASSPVLVNDAEGDWTPTQYQVANFRHSPIAALKDSIIEDYRAGGGAVDDEWWPIDPDHRKEIEDALEAADYTE